MTFRDTFFNVKQLLVNRLIDFGLEDADMDFGWTTLLTLAQNTRVTIDVPLNLTYSDEFTITGTLETATYRRLSYKTLKLKVGNTIVDTTETDINGTYSFTTTPVSMGNHSFQVIFEGTNIYNASESSVINRVIGKETSVINLDIIPTTHINGSTIVAGTLKSDDAELIKNATMKMSTTSGNTLTTTTNNYGQFSFTLTDIPDFNNVSITCYFEGDTYYSSSTITTPIAVYQEALELTSDKSILSYADSDYATLTVQYKDEGDMNLGANKRINLYKVYEADDIKISADKPILSYADNDTAVISAQFQLNNKNVKIPNETIYFTDGTQDFTDEKTISDYDEIDCFPGGDGCIIDFQAKGQLGFSVKNSGGTEKILYQLSSSSYATFKLIDDGQEVKLLMNNNVVYSSSADNQSYVHAVHFYIYGNGYVKSFSMKTISFTDNSGKATYTYVSKGVGDVDITVEHSDLQSETYEVLDCQFYDDGVTGSLSASWVDTNCTVTRETDGYTSIKDTSSQNGFHKLNMSIPSGSVIYIDIYQVDGGISSFPFLFRNPNNQYLNGFSLNHVGGSLGNWYTLKIEITTTQLKITNLNNSRTATRDYASAYSPSDNVVMTMTPYKNMTEIRYKNLKVYPVFVSHTYEVLDCAFYDSGLQATENTDWIVSSGTLSKSFSGDGKTIAPSTSANLMIYANKPSTTSTSAYDWTPPFVVEFEVTAQTDTPRFQTYDDDTSVAYDLNLSQTGEYKITYDGTTIYSYRKVDGTYTEINHFDRNLQNARIGFVVANGKSLTYKGFKIY